MHVSINLDTDDLRTHSDVRRTQAIRAAAYFLLHVIGDMQDETAVPTGTKTGETAPVPPPPVPSVPAVPTQTMPTAFTAPPPPPGLVNTEGFDNSEDDEGETSNVINFPVPPPPPPPPPSANTAAPIPPAPPATIVAAALTVASALNNGSATIEAPEYDAAGMPWDARIHQKSKNKKKDNTWKI